MTEENNIQMQIALYSKNLRLPIFARDFEKLAIESAETGASYVYITPKGYHYFNRKVSSCLSC